MGNWLESRKEEMMTNKETVGPEVRPGPGALSAGAGCWLALYGKAHGNTNAVTNRSGHPGGSRSFPPLPTYYVCVCRFRVSDSSWVNLGGVWSFLFKWGGAAGGS